MSTTTDHGLDIAMDPNTLDFYDDFRESSGRTQLIEACIRRICTNRTRLIDDPNYGINIEDYINDDINQRKIAMISSNIDQELQKDQRVFRSITKSTFNKGILTATITIIDNDGPFTLVLNISNVNITLLKV
jgi:hypothetical protein